MSSLRWRFTFVTVGLLSAIWVLALVGFSIARSARVTPEGLLAYIRGHDLKGLRGEDRVKALREVARQLNSLSLEDRRKARLDSSLWRWFDVLSEEEKIGFVEQTMPTGMKQMLEAFEELPAEKRQRAIDDALKQLRQTGDQLSAAGGADEQAGTNSPSLSPELEARIRTVGLRTFYTQSSAQTKAELAPVLEEVQRAMQSGRFIERRRGH